MLKNVLIVVDDIEKSIEFYKDLFGMQVILKNEGNVILSEGLVLQDAAEHSLSCALSLYISKRWEGKEPCDITVLHCAIFFRNMRLD